MWFYIKINSAFLADRRRRGGQKTCKDVIFRWLGLLDACMHFLVWRRHNPHNFVVILEEMADFQLRTVFHH